MPCHHMQPVTECSSGEKKGRRAKNGRGWGRGKEGEGGGEGGRRGRGRKRAEGEIPSHTSTLITPLPCSPSLEPIDIQPLCDNCSRGAICQKEERTDRIKSLADTQQLLADLCPALNAKGEFCHGVPHGWQLGPWIYRFPIPAVISQLALARWSAMALARFPRLFVWRSLHARLCNWLRIHLVNFFIQ